MIRSIAEQDLADAARSARRFAQPPRPIAAVHRAAARAADEPVLKAGFPDLDCVDLALDAIDFVVDKVVSTPAPTPRL